MTGRIDHQRAPLLDALAAYAEGGIYPFHTPGHKGGHFAAPELAMLVGRRGMALDLPAMTATDNTFHPTGCVREAQALAADLFGAAATFYLTAGSTLGVAAALLATVATGRTVAMPRNVHRSVVAGLVLSGAVPRFIPHDVLPECGALGVTAENVANTLDAGPTPDAVLLTRPSYYGLAGDLTDVVSVCRARGVPLIVDEAHGAHLHFLSPHRDGKPARHTASELRAAMPRPALADGADLVVQSCHKTLGSLVGSAQLHVGRRSTVDAAEIRDAINFLQTTSPSYLLLASLDATRRWLWREGRSLFADAVAEIRQLEQQIEAMPGLRLLRPEASERLAGHRRDPLRLVVHVADTGWNGYDVESLLRSEFRVEDEMADWFNIIFVLSPHDDPAARQRLVDGLREVSRRSPDPGGAGTSEQPAGSRPPDPLRLDSTSGRELLQPPIPPLAMPPRQAALGKKKAVPLDRAAGRVSAEMIMFYPPGIPLLMPGERVTDSVLEVSRRLLAAGAQPYASDPSLDSIRVVV